MPKPPLHRLWRPPSLQSEHPEAPVKETWLELFYDLVYVAVFIQLGDRLSNDVSWRGVWRFAVIFVPVWWAWSNFAFYMNRFVVDDLWHRLIVAFQVFCVAWMGLSVAEALGAQSTQFVLLYITFRVTLVVLYLRTLKPLPATRALAIRYITDYHLVAITLWGASLFLEPLERWVLWIVAFLWELLNSQRSLFRRFHLEHPLNGEHLRERFGTLTLLVLGESFIKSITSERSLGLTPEVLLVSLPGIFLLFSLWWLYFEDADGAYDNKETTNPTLWLYTHLPLSMALVSFGVATKKLLTSVYEGRLGAEYALLYCASLTVYCLALVIINLWGKKVARRQRAFVRFAAALAMGGVFLLWGGREAVWFTSAACAIFLLQVIHDLYLARRYPEADPEVGELTA